ncbi:MAG: hypothetical protein IKO00_13360 [Oscillospiraceae bacterium]|nr:hypothetical protein [Oscillospiraceae bacterium]
MSTLKSIIFETLPDPEEYYETAEALRDLDRQYQHFTRTVWKASKQLLKFDEINRLVAYEVEEKAPKTTTTRASSGRSSSSSKSTSNGSKSTTTKSNPKTRTDDTQVPDLSKDFALELNLKDILFSWLDLDWEKVMATLIAGLTTISGGLIGATIGGAVGGLTGGPIGLEIGLTAGLVFGILADNFAFNWDGKLDKEEFFNAINAILPAILGGVAGVVIGGPAGAAIGLTIGTLISLNVMHFDYSDIIHKIQGFFVDLTGVYDKEWNTWSDLVHGLWDALKTWWHGLTLGRFDFKLPHLTVTWQELGDNSILARYLGITAIPHMGVEWYARGGIVDGATLIGAGEQGREAIIPLERHTEWIHMVAVQLKEELEKLTPPTPQLIRMIPATASAMVPYAATVAPAPAAEAPDLSGLADTIAHAIAEIGSRPPRDQEIRVYLDGRQLSDVVTRYQRRDSRANGG